MVILVFSGGITYSTFKVLNFSPEPLQGRAGGAITSLSVAVSAPLLASRALPCLSELRPHSYHFHPGHLLCCLCLLQDGGAEV